MAQQGISSCGAALQQRYDRDITYQRTSFRMKHSDSGRRIASCDDGTSKHKYGLEEIDLQSETTSAG